MGVRLIDTVKLIDVLLHEREQVDGYCYDGRDKEAVRFEAISDCVGIINHFAEYAKKDDVPVLTVSDVIHRFTHGSFSVVMKRSDTGREYRKIKDALDDKNWWEVIGFYPRIKTDGNNHASVELVLWCRERGSAIGDLHRDVMADYVADLFGCGESGKDGDPYA